MTRSRDLPRFVDGIDLTKEYPIHDIMDMFYGGKLRGVAQAGWVVQAVGEDTTMIRFVPWWESHLQRREEDRLRVHPEAINVDAMREDVEREHPMRRRTPQQRTAAMMVRLMSEAKKTGSVPGLTPEQIRAIIGESWRQGEPLAAEDVQKVAAWFMSRGEVDNREADSHRTTRAHQFA